MNDQNQVQDVEFKETPNETIQLSPRETHIIQTHSTIRFAAASRLSKQDNIDIQEARKALHAVMKERGDAARVAYALFALEYDNSVPPYGKAFEQMEQIDWDTALKMWAEGYIDPETL